MYRSAFWMVHICLFGCQAGGHLWSVQCLVSLFTAMKRNSRLKIKMIMFSSIPVFQNTRVEM